MLNNPHAPLVPQQVLAPPQARRLSVERVGTLATNVFRVEDLANRVDQVAVRLGTQLRACDTNLARAFTEEAGLKGRIVSRGVGLRRE